MAHIQLKDNRAALAMTAEEADAIFQQLAQETIINIKAQAKLEQALANIKEQSSTLDKQFRAIIAPLEKQLTDYIDAHPERFQKPRMRKTIWGAYGVRTATKLEITDELGLLAYLKANRIPAVVVKESIDRKAVEKAISDGQDMPGAEIRTGTVAKYEVAKELLDKAEA